MSRALQLLLGFGRVRCAAPHQSVRCACYRPPMHAQSSSSTIGPMTGPMTAARFFDAKLSELPCTELVQCLRDLAGEEREIQAAFLVHLEEFDRRRWYLDSGHASLWDWCLR